MIWLCYYYCWSFYLLFLLTFWFILFRLTSLLSFLWKRISFRFRLYRLRLLLNHWILKPISYTSIRFNCFNFTLNTNSRFNWSMPWPCWLKYWWLLLNSRFYWCFYYFLRWLRILNFTFRWKSSCSFTRSSSLFHKFSCWIHISISCHLICFFCRLLQWFLFLFSRWVFSIWFFIWSTSLFHIFCCRIHITICCHIVSIIFCFFINRRLNFISTSTCVCLVRLICSLN